VKKVLWMISISRNSIVVIIGMILAYNLEEEGEDLPFKITSKTSTILSLLLFYWSQIVLRIITQVI
jgi:hypothetical protein